MTLHDLEVRILDLVSELHRQVSKVFGHVDWAPPGDLPIWVMAMMHTQNEGIAADFVAGLLCLPRLRLKYTLFKKTKHT